MEKTDKEKVLKGLGYIAGLTGVCFLAGASLAISTRQFRIALAPTELTVGEADAILQASSEGRVRADKVFSGPAGFTGVTIRSQSGDGIAWLTNNKENIVVGMLLDNKGNNLTKAAQESFFAKSHSSDTSSAASDTGSISAQVSAALIKELAALPYIAAGNSSANKVLYVFGDANCIHCENLFRVVKAADLSNVFIHWIPVAVLGEKSLDQAATLLSLPVNERFSALASHHGPLHENIALMEHNDKRYASLKKDIYRSNALLSTLGSGTPLLAYSNGASIDIVPRSLTTEEFVDVLGKIH